MLIIGKRGSMRFLALIAPYYLPKKWKKWPIVRRDLNEKTTWGEGIIANRPYFWNKQSLDQSSAHALRIYSFFFIIRIWWFFEAISLAFQDFFVWIRPKNVHERDDKRKDNRVNLLSKMKNIRASHHRNSIIFNFYLNFRENFDKSRVILTLWIIENFHKNVKNARFGRKKQSFGSGWGK